ncbi:uncharacterized protein LOC122325550 isoform X1 [Puntigrus tetrazona]|nr:uncharacterized protein LOC122325550 isoform X1 [Puntigrus tetrazona]
MVLKRKSNPVKTQSVGLIKTSLVQADSGYEPFLLDGFVSFSGQLEDRVAVRVLRDTGAARSLIRGDVLPFSKESGLDSSILVQAELTQRFPEVFPACVLTRSQTKRMGTEFTLDDTFMCTDHPVQVDVESVSVKEHPCQESESEQRWMLVPLELVLCSYRKIKKHFEVYVGSTPYQVIVYTDHNPLTFLCRMYNHNQRLMRWALIVQDYNLEIRHKRGTDNVVADALSRV